MMRFILITLLILAIIAIAPMLISEPGYIAIAMGGKIIELTVYTAVFWFAVTLILTLLSIHLLKRGFRFSFGGWRKIAFASHRRAIKDFNKGIAAYVLGDYQQAEHLLAKSAEPALQQQTAYLLAASAAEKQNLRPNTQHYLNLLEEHTSGQNTIKTAGLESIIVKLQLLISHNEHAKARAIIDKYHKHVGHDVRLLQLEIDLCLTEKRFEPAIQHLVSARKQKDFNQKSLSQSEAIAFNGMFKELLQQHDQQTLANYWQKLPKKVKQREAILFAYCRILADNSILAPLEELLLPALKKDASESFIQQLTCLPLDKTANKAESLISAVQKHLHKNQDSIKWLTALGHLALASGQWPMSDKAFHRLFTIEGYQIKNRDLIASAKALSEQSKHQQANELLRKALG
ncbi:MAG: heme biosynthesis protein HemY [Colwellia sp.]|nr:heme biosynthesis protein HemY [Colwellia sp.]